MAETPQVLVVGSVNMDLVVRATHMPAPGETVLGKSFVTSPGGKGGNQAVAAAKLGAHAKMIARVGDDVFGEQLLEALKGHGVDCSDVMITEDCSSGTATIIVDGIGENAIVVAGGANAHVTPDDVFSRAGLFDAADVVLLQLELPLPTVRAARTMARRYGCTVILDPAPAPPSLGTELCQVDILTPNIIEAERITRYRAGEDRAERNTALDLLAKGAEAVVLKLGSRGSLAAGNGGQLARLMPYKVDIVDTTGAGDAFTAALGVAVANGQALEQAARFANAAGALACTTLGAQRAMPTLDEVRMLMADQQP